MKTAQTATLPTIAPTRGAVGIPSGPSAEVEVALAAVDVDESDADEDEEDEAVDVDENLDDEEVEVAGGRTMMLDEFGFEQPSMLK